MKRRILYLSGFMYASVSRGKAERDCDLCCFTPLRRETRMSSGSGKSGAWPVRRPPKDLGCSPSRKKPPRYALCKIRVASPCRRRVDLGTRVSPLALQERAPRVLTEEDKAARAAVKAAKEERAGHIAAQAAVVDDALAEKAGALVDRFSPRPITLFASNAPGSEAASVPAQPERRLRLLWGHQHQKQKQSQSRGFVIVIFGESEQAARA